MKNNLLKTLTSTLIFLNIIFLMMLFFSIGKNARINQAFSPRQTAKIQITVLEESSLIPINNATVCIVDSRHYEKTNKHGRTSIISVPIIPSNNFSMSTLPQFGYLTILVYKTGYSDNLTLNYPILPETLSVGLTIKMRPIINEEDLEPTILSTVPNIDWCKKLIKLYKKN